MPRVSIIIPARDEATRLPRLLASLQNVDAEIIVIASGEAGTANVARAAGARVIEEPPLPPGWVGKSWACHVGRQAATGEFLLFTDADTELSPAAWRRAPDADLVTGIGLQELETFAERVCMPPVFAIINAATGDIRDPEHAVANGQFMLFRASAYDRIGGHEAVKGSVTEDLALARLAARNGLDARFYDLSEVLRVRMYNSFPEMFAGWRKNFEAGRTQTPAAATLQVMLTFFLGLLWPAALLLGGGAAAAGLAVGAIMTTHVRLMHSSSEGPTWLHAALHPFGFAFVGVVVVASAFDRFSGRGALWKGRRYK